MSSRIIIQILKASVHNLKYVHLKKLVPNFTIMNIYIYMCD